MEKKFDFSEGAIGDPGNITVYTDYHGSGPDRCRHARPLKRTDPEYVKKDYLDEHEQGPDGEQFVVPKVVVAYNQGGHDCTHVCVDCVTEAIEGIQ